MFFIFATLACLQVIKASPLVNHQFSITPYRDDSLMDLQDDGAMYETATEWQASTLINLADIVKFGVTSLQTTNIFARVSTALTHRAIIALKEWKLLNRQL